MEFALVAAVFLPLCLGIIEAGFLLWTQDALQSVASFTARCAALASPDCTAGATPSTGLYAVAAANTWVLHGIITSANVASATVCVSSVSYQRVTITSTYWAGTVLPPPLRGLTLTAVAYFPVTTC